MRGALTFPEKVSGQAKQHEAYGYQQVEKFLRAGDRMRVAVEGLGEQNSRLVAYSG